MNLRDLIVKARSFRRFDESYQVSGKALETLVDMARLSASGANRQPLKFAYFNTKKDCDRVFPYLAWAGYLTDWPGPEKDERPTAYIMILGDKTISEIFGVDHGIAAQSIMLGAVESGLGGCIIGSVKREEMSEAFSIPDNLEILLILALGKPIEKVVIEDIKNNDVKYWRDDSRVHHVPKRSLKELIIKL